MLGFDNLLQLEEFDIARCSITEPGAPFFGLAYVLADLQ